MQKCNNYKKIINKKRKLKIFKKLYLVNFKLILGIFRLILNNMAKQIYFIYDNFV